MLVIRKAIIRKPYSLPLEQIHTTEGRSQVSRCLRVIILAHIPHF